MPLLSEDELRRRASRIKLVLTDVDGVLTDTGVYYSPRGEEFKRFSIRDGMGMEILREHGIETAMITRENSGSVRARSEKLQLPFAFLGIWDKRAFLPQLLQEVNLAPEQLGYIGDDVNDLEIMTDIAPFGLIACPNDAMPAIRNIVHHHASAKAGYGAFRDFAEWILLHRQR